MKRRFWAGLLSFVMLWSLLPASALAANEEDAVKYGEYKNSIWEAMESSGTVENTGIGGVKSVSKTAVPVKDDDGNVIPNQFDVTLNVVMEQATTTVQPGAAATVLVMDVSGSMDYCAECGHKIGNGSWHERGCKYENKRNYASRLEAAQAAAREFLKTYSGRFGENGQETSEETQDLGRYVSLVAFSTGAKVKVEWADVSNAAGYQKALKAVNDLEADGGTNLEQGFVKANGQLKQDAVKNISEKNVIALTDGVPTFYGKDYLTLLGEWTANGHGNIGCPDTNAATVKAASALKASPAKLYTVCFGAADTKCWEKNSLHKDNIWPYPDEYHKDDGPTVGTFLSESIATKREYAYNAGNTAELMQAFKAITDTITTGLNAGTVTDGLPAGVTTTDSAFADGKMTWNLNAEEAEPSDAGSGKTTYSWTKTYRVSIDPTKVAAGTEYQPLNTPTTLEVTVGGEKKTVAFPIPAGKVTPLTTLTVTATGYEGTYDGKDHGEAATANIDGAKIEYSTDNGTTWSETVPTIKNVGETKVLVRATLNGYADAEDEYTLKVNYAPVTVTADNQSVQLGSSALGYTATVTG